MIDIRGRLINAVLPACRTEEAAGRQNATARASQRATWGLIPAMGLWPQQALERRGSDRARYSSVCGRRSLPTSS